MITTDTDAALLLEQWLMDTFPDPDTITIKLSDIDEKLHLSPGTAKRLLPSLTEAVYYEIKMGDEFVRITRHMMMFSV